MSRTPVKSSNTTRCCNCQKMVPNYDSVSVGSRDSGYREMCWQCFNTESAKADGLDKFEHLNFEPVRIEDCEGRPHDFHFRTRLFGPGVALDAFELCDGYPAGYRFQAIGNPEEDLLELLGRLVAKIRRALSVKYLQKGSLGLEIAGKSVQGQITWDEDKDGRVPMVVIDGREVTWDQFGRMLMTFESWQFKLDIRDKSEEF